MNRTKPESGRATSGRVSPTAPESKSASSNVWRALERVPGFNERLNRGRKELDAGKRVEFEPDDRPG